MSKMNTIYNPELETLQKEMGRAHCEVVGILKHKNGRVNATFRDLMSKKNGWPNQTTTHKSMKAAIEYFKEIGDYIDSKGGLDESGLRTKR